MGAIVLLLCFVRSRRGKEQSSRSTHSKVSAKSDSKEKRGAATNIKRFSKSLLIYKKPLMKPTEDFFLAKIIGKLTFCRI
jgi:hypothetical protein